MRNALAERLTLRRRITWWLIGLAAVILFVVATASDSGLQQFNAPAGSSGTAGPVDQSIYQTSRNIARLAATPQEQHLAVTAMRAADHELDQSFVSAIRKSTRHSESHNPAIAEGLETIAGLKAAVKKDKESIASLQNNRVPDTDERGEKLRLAEAQLALDNDELDNAQLDFARLDANKESELQQVFDQHQSVEDGAATLPKDTLTAPFETPAAMRSVGGKLKVRFLLVERALLIEQAQAKASEALKALQAEHNRLEKAGPPIPSSESETREARVASLSALAERQKEMGDLDHRIRDLGQLQRVYDDWRRLLKQQLYAIHVGIGHDILTIAMAILGALVLSGAIRTLFGNWERKYHQRLDNARLLVLVILQIVVAWRLFTVIFGMPSDISTLVGLITAGITIALRDLIVSFVGWFVLMGRSGIRVGDWVEINGTQGEVAQITRLHTFVLETGNWTTDGHPTGRQAIFMNKFAVEGKYFNFSTPGQWLWDQLSIPIPPGTQVSADILARIREIIETATQEDSRHAEESWRDLVKTRGLVEFAPTPTVSLKTSAAGLEIIIRYVSKAECRFGVSVLIRQAVLGTIGLVDNQMLTGTLNRVS